jgi:hypothetical protein
MRHPKRKTHRGSGGLRDAVVGVRPFDSSVLAAGYIVVSTTAPTNFGRESVPAGFIMLRPCCVVEVRGCRLSDGTNALVFVSHLNGEAVVATDESAMALVARLGLHGRLVAYVA